MNEYKQEVWYARELQEALAYSQWRSFKEVIEKAMDACKASGNQVYDHFAEVIRYACCLIVMNGNPRKEVIALGQTYFAMKT